MTRLPFIFFIASLMFACQRSDHAEEHVHDEEPSRSYTIYSEKTELFVEFKPLVVGESSRFAAHFTALGESFTALEEGTITLSLIVGDKGIRQTTDTPSSPGIFRFSLNPTISGTGRLIFDIKTKKYTDRITIDSVTVFADMEEANRSTVDGGPEGEIPFLKEQAWKIEFANKELKPRSFHQVIKVAGELSAKPSDEQVVTARASGTVRWNDNIVAGASVRQGQQLFVLVSGNVTEGNIESQYREAKANVEKAEADYNRVQPLLADKIISQKDYLEIKNRYDQAKIRFETLSRNYINGGLSVLSPMSGFIKQIAVRSGDFVEAGQAMTVITKDQSLQLRAEVPLRHANQLPLIAEANFKTVHDDKIHNTRELNGKVLSYGKSVGDEVAILPIYFSLNNDGTLIPGDAVEVYLKSRPVANALVVPVSALIEEQGKFYVYIQISGEGFSKRPVTIGGQDGTSVQILSGVNAGERVVTKGAHLIRLATQSGSVPAHGHEH